MSKRILCLALLGAMAVATPAIADDAEDAKDEEFTTAVQDFGYAAGAAWQCADEAARGGIERQALQAYNGLARLFGTDEAFFFSAAFGSGTSSKIEKADCPKFQSQFEEGMKKGAAQ